MANESNDINPDSEEFLRKKPSDALMVVGVGASAGGVQALQEFFEHVQPGNGIAYVVILHMSPDYDSRLAEVLQRVSKLSVSQVTQKVKIEPDHIYVVPPSQHLIIIDGDIAVTPNTEVGDRRAPIDIFFRTLADKYGPRAIAVILSGTGANGSMGLKRVKEFGGAAIVQNPREAEFNEMPRNAIATGIVDEVLSVREMPARIINYKDRVLMAQVTVEADVPTGDQQQALREVLTQIHVQTGHDFSNYKRPTLLRRIERRINVRNVANLDAYAELLRGSKEETSALLKDLLISVTNFFRDKKPFEIIETDILREILKRKSVEDQLRIWVAGCATGEEAYSLAMLCAERTLNVIDAPKVQIFATDIDDSAIAQARDGLYTINDAADVSPERLRRFFNKEGELYRIRPEVREMVLFVNHNIIKDPPFSHLDIISCRNVLIYLNRAAQERVMETFHFALEPEGYLLLGLSETADAAADYYNIVNRDNHIYQKRRITASRIYPVPESVPNVYLTRAARSVAERTEQFPLSHVHLLLLEQYAPPSLVVDENYDIVHVSERAGRYLQVGAGEPSQNLLKLIRPELRLEVRAALYQAVQRLSPAESRGVTLTVDGVVETINIQVRPVLKTDGNAKGLILVLFEPVATGENKETVVLTSDEPVARQLEEELTRVKLKLRASNEQHEFHTEELKASNEELQAMNEELRSSTEELETSKEELQSINEELRTVNQELKVKVEETTLASNNLQNFINSVDIGAIFLDRALRVSFFTPRARELFNVIGSDFGRPLSDITHRFEYEGLMNDVESVLNTLVPAEKVAHTRDGKTFMMRILPYRTSEDRINGVVLTFIDLISRKKIEEELRSSEEQLRLVLESAKDYAIFTLDNNRKISTWNTGAEAMVGYSEEEIIGTPGDIIFTPEDRDKKAPELEVKKAREESFAENERWHQRKDGSRFYGSGTVRPLMDSAGKVIGFLKIMRDLTESKKAADSLRESEERFRAIVSQTTAGIFSCDLAGRLTVVNKKLCDMLGYREQELVGRYLWDITHEDDLEKNKELFATMTLKGYANSMDKRLVHKDGHEIWVSESLSAICDEEGRPQSGVAVVLDITERKYLEQQKEEFIGIASHELKTPVTSIKAYAEILHDKFLRSDQPDNAHLMQKLNTQVDRLAELIRDLLDTTKIAEGKLLLHLQPLDLNKLIGEHLEELQRITPSSPIVFKQSKIKSVNGDAERIGQVLTNLVMNAVKYSPSGSEVVVATKEVKGGVQVSVSDQGVGIAADVREKVFERFFRVNNPKSESLPGMGLGLYISAGIIQRHGGTIGVDSKEGKGSVFYFVLPY